MPGHTKCCTCHQNNPSKPEDLMLQNAKLLKKSVPWPPTYLTPASLVLRLPCKMHLCRSSSNVPHLPTFLKLIQNPHVFLPFDRVHNPLRMPHRRTLQRLKVAQHRLFISHPPRRLRTRRFSEPTFRPSGAPNHWKTQGMWLSYLFAHLHLLASHSFSSLILPTCAFYLSTLSEVCF